MRAKEEGRRATHLKSGFREGQRGRAQCARPLSLAPEAHAAAGPHLGASSNKETGLVFGMRETRVVHLT